MFFWMPEENSNASSYKGNKGEWSELYAFAKLLKDGRIYAADRDVNKIEDIYFPILKIIRNDETNNDVDYMTGENIRIYRNGVLLGEMTKHRLSQKVKILFEKIFQGGSGKGAFEIPEIDDFISDMKLTTVKASSREKVDIRLQLHDINTGFNRESGFSIKSDVGAPPTLLNSGKNTRFKYQVCGADDNFMHSFNSINKSVCREYMQARMKYLTESKVSLKYVSMKSEIFEDNLMLIDSMLPEIYSYFIYLHYTTMPYMNLDCAGLCDMLGTGNPLGLRHPFFYRYKLKKLFCSSALGMTPGKAWNGYDAATGGYIIVKRDGDVLCYHIYNRDHFEDYLIDNTVVDRPSTSRHDYGYIYKEDNDYYIDLNIQIRFKQIYENKSISSQ